MSFCAHSQAHGVPMRHSQLNSLSHGSSEWFSHTRDTATTQQHNSIGVLTLPIKVKRQLVSTSSKSTPDNAARTKGIRRVQFGHRKIRQMTRLKGYQRPRLYAWRPHEDAQLRAILAEGKGVAFAAKVLARTEDAVRARAVKLKVSSARNPNFNRGR
jgi:hypothetical protein